LIDESSIAIEFIDVALSDFGASKLLFDGGFYSQALFMLQQSLEKAAKAILLKLKLVDVEGIGEKIGHSIRRVSLESILLKIAMEFIDSITYELLAHLNEVKLYASNDHRIAIDKLCNELKENINQTITIASSLLSKPARSRGEIYKMYDRVKVLSKKALSKLDEETLKGINELMCEINMERFIKLIPNEITKTITSLQKMLSSAMNYITSNEQRIEICKTYEEQMNRFIMKLQLAITLYMLILWYKPFEKKISQLRYPNHKMKHNPININENTTLTQWAKMIIEKINEMDMLKCIKELVKEKIESRKCRETLEFLKNDMINASSITSLQM
jgi:HEPN domain-containing protein